MGARHNAYRQANRGDYSQIRGLEGVSHNTFVLVLWLFLGYIGSLHLFCGLTVGKADHDSGVQVDG